MASRATYRHSLIRDLPPAFFLAGGAVVMISLFAFLSPNWSPAREEANSPRLKGAGIELNEFNFDNRYAGEIITGSIIDDECRKLILDNRNGNMWDKGRVNCPDRPRQSLQADNAGVKGALRLREISKAFRH
jgi:hypothetical protein